LLIVTAIVEDTKYLGKEPFIAAAVQEAGRREGLIGTG
jgi:hypothetical protein